MLDGRIDSLIKDQLAQYHLFREQLAESREQRGARTAPVITVSRMTGCCARDVSQLLAARLDLQVWGPELIDLVAKDAQLGREVAALLDADTLARVDGEVEAMVARRRCRDDESTRALVRMLRILAETGGVVIHGRGGAIVLRDRADLRLRLVAGDKQRLKTVMKLRELEEREAGIMMRAGDSKRSAFVRLLFHSDVENPRHYDMVLNSERLEPEDVTELAVRLLALKGHQVD
jgi:cytidylate kinase